MKKIMFTLVGISLLVALGACTKNQTKSEDTEMSSSVEKVVKDSSTSAKKEDTQSVFTAILAEDGQENESADHSIRLVLKEVEAVEDPEKIINMMKNDGVILNVSTEQLGNLTKENLKAGDKIQFTLAGLPAMTMSIPPQVAGNAVIKVEKQ